MNYQMLGHCKVGFLGRLCLLPSMLVIGLNAHMGILGGWGLVDQFIFPEKYYARFAFSPIDLSRNDKATAMFKLKYRGAYSIGIVLKNFTDELYYVKERYQPKFIIKFDFFIDGKLVKSTQSGSELFPVVNPSQGSGYYIYIFNGPNDLPLDKEIVYNAEVVTPDFFLQQKYGPTKLFIVKEDDW